jgi:hypothetical protein
MTPRKGWAQAARSVVRSLRRPRASKPKSSGSASGSPSLNVSAKLSGVVANTSDVSAKLSGVVANTSDTYDAYGQFLKDELAAQDARKASFEQRGLAVITTSGTLVTLLFALAALSTNKSQTFVLPHKAHTWLLYALLLFFLSALAALVTNAPLIYQAVEAEKVRERLREKPPRSTDSAAQDIAFTRADALESAKTKNSIKGWSLALAMLFEAGAVGCVAVAISIIL